MMVWKTFVFITVLATAALPQSSEIRAMPITDSDIQLLREDLQAEKNKVITDTMSFTATEAASFSPVPPM